MFSVATRSLVLASVVVALFASCGGSAKPPATPQCTLNSDCKSTTLQCVQGYCVSACATSVDCPNNERCIAVDVGGFTCQPPEKKTCGSNTDCDPLFCAIDLVCRNQCTSDRDCPGGALTPPKQICTASKLCIDPVLDAKNYDPITNDLKPPGSTGTGGIGGSNGGGGSGSGTGGRNASGGTGGGNNGTGGNGVKTCVNPQTQFGSVAVGTMDPNFTSGVGVGTATQLLIFNGYSGPLPNGFDAGATSDPDAGAATGNFIYMQSFDRANPTKVPAPVAAPLFQAAPEGKVYVYDVAVAPTGEIALLHYNATPNVFATLYVSFLKMTTADGGAPSLQQVLPAVRLDPGPSFAYPHVIWSAARGAFVISWKYYTTNWFTRVRNFMPSGVGASGDTFVVPTTSGVNNDSAWDEGEIGTSGKLFGAAYRNATTGAPDLTILDTDGLQVGDIIHLSGLGVSHWVATGGTTTGFVALFNSGAIAQGVFVPTSGAASVVPDGGAPVDAGDTGDAGAPRVFDVFSYPSNATTARMVSDDTGGSGGVGAVLLESNGANFLYVTADNGKHLAVGTVLSPSVASAGSQLALSNYQGSYTVSLYENSTHLTQAIASGCP